MLNTYEYNVGAVKALQGTDGSARSPKYYKIQYKIPKKSEKLKPFASHSEVKGFLHV